MVESDLSADLAWTIDAIEMLGAFPGSARRREEEP